MKSNLELWKKDSTKFCRSSKDLIKPTTKRTRHCWISSGVNFINVLRANFGAKKRILAKKIARKMLMTLTTGVNFSNGVFILKCFAKLFSNYSLAFYFFGKMKSVQNLLVKCYLNWAKVSISPTFYKKLFVWKIFSVFI